VEQIGTVTAVQKQGRHADLSTVETPHSRRWVTPTTYQFRDFVDQPDTLRMLFSPQGHYARAFANALGRAMDDAIIAAATGTSVTGEEAGSTEAFDTTNYSIASSSVGMTVAKLISAKEKLLAAEVDEDDEIFVILASDQIEDLLGETQVTSIDYNSVRTLVEGGISRFMGMTFIHSERLAYTGSTDRYCLCWAKSGMHLGIWDEIRTPIDWLPEKQAWQVAGIGDFGATRLEQGKVVRIICSE
jgi:hypothetical protein